MLQFTIFYNENLWKDKFNIAIDTFEAFSLFDEKVLNIRGGRGYGVGHPYPVKSGPQVNQGLGSPGPYETDEETTEDEPVKISKAFKKE